MIAALLALALGAAPAAVEPPVPVIRHEEPPAAPPVALAGAPDVVELCRRLVPAERLAYAGDAVEQGEARARQEEGRDQAIEARYALTAPAGKLAFAPYLAAERRLEVVAPATLRLGDGAAVLTAQEERGLPVRVEAAAARRILAAQRAGRLSLRLLFDLPDEAACTSDRRGRRFTLGVEPVEWQWLDGEEVLAWGGVAADRPAVSAAAGAVALVEVGEPLEGPAEARKVVASRQPALEACYAEALKGAPALDGVLVVELGAKVAVAGSSATSPDLARCVEGALAPLAHAGRIARAQVPIRFELVAPEPGEDGGR